MTFDGLFQDVFFIAVPVYNVLICFVLQFIRQRGKRYIRAIFSLQRPFKQVITNVRVFRQERAMQVGGDYIFVNHSLVARFSGISKSVENFSKRGMVSNVSASAMIFKPYNRSIEQRAV